MSEDENTAASWYETSRVASPERPRLNADLDVDVCVIGGGLAGLTVAREVARRGWSVAVLEANRVAWAASGRNTGFVLPGFHETIDSMVERIGLDFERDVQIEVMLVLELERHVGRLEEGEARAVVELEEGVQHAGAGIAAGHGLLDLERVHERQTEEILVEAPRLFGIAAAIGVVMQTLDHGTLLSNWPVQIACQGCPLVEAQKPLKVS